MSSKDESSTEEEDSASNTPKHGPPGFSFSKSAIADLPSTAVQSIYIDNEVPVEVDDDVFTWRDPNGLKLPAKSKVKKGEGGKGKQAPPSQPPSPAAKGPAAKANPVAATHTPAVKQSVTPAAPSSAPPPAKEIRVASKNRLVKERPSQRKVVTPNAAVPKRATSGTKAVTAESVTRQVGKGSQTKMVTKQNSREKNVQRREQQHHGQPK